MRNLGCKVATAVVMSTVLISCGNPNDPQQSSEVTFTGPLNASATSALTYGSIYYVVSDSNGGYRGTYNIGAGGDSVVANIPNGTYKFYALGAAAYSSSSPSNGFNTTSVYCGGGTSVTLDGNPVSLSTSLSSSACYSNSTYSGDYAKSTVRTLTVSFCGSSAFANISGYGDSCPTSYTGSSSSIKIGYTLQNSNYAGTNNPAVTTGLYSNCIALSSNTASVDLAAYGNANSAGSPLSLGILTYSGTGCSGSVIKSWSFPNGLGTNVSPTGSAEIYSTSAAAQLYLDAE